MEAEHTRPKGSRLPTIFCAGAVLLIMFQLVVLLPEWRLWRTSAAEVYPGQHRGLVFGSISSILLALAIPIPIVVTHSSHLTQGRKRLLYVLSSALLVSAVALLLIGRSRG